MKAFILIAAALLLPFAAIGTFTYATYLSMRDGAAAGNAPTLLFGAGIAMVIVIFYCIVSLQRLYAARRRADGREN